jgi:hypothetical protein
MEDESVKLEGAIKEIIEKIKSLTLRLQIEFKNLIIDPLILEEIRKNVKVG